MNAVITYLRTSPIVFLVSKHVIGLGTWNIYLSFAGRAFNSSLISSTFPFKLAAFSAAAAATASLFDAEQPHALAARQAQAREHAPAHAAAAFFTPRAPPREQSIAQAALPSTQHAPTIRPEVNTWKLSYQL